MIPRLECPKKLHCLDNVMSKRSPDQYYLLLYLLRRARGEENAVRRAQLRSRLHVYTLNVLSHALKSMRRADARVVRRRSAAPSASLPSTSVAYAVLFDHRACGAIRRQRDAIAIVHIERGYGVSILIKELE